MLATHTTHLWRKLAGWWWLVSLASLPLVFDPLRVESFESPRATLITVLGLGIGLAALAAWGSLSSAERRTLLRQPITLTVIAWALCCAVSALLSLSAAHSTFGDIYRRMGLLTQLSLLMAFVGASLLSRRQRGLAWPVLAVASLLVASYGILEWLGLSPFVVGWVMRPSSTLGVHVRAASWIVMAVLWLGAGLIAQWRDNRPNLIKRRWLYALSLLLSLIFLLLTQSRGAALGLAAGLLTFGLAWAITHRQRWLIYLLAGIAILGAVAGFSLYTLDLRGSPVANVPLVGRLSASTDGETSVFRLLLWHSAAQIVLHWPTMIAADREANSHPDSLSVLRPWVGYGQEMFETVERQYFSNDLQATTPALQPIDRAHNMLLDTLITQGVLGLISLLAVYLAAAATAIHVLRQQSYLWSERGWMAAAALAILVAHFVDLQFTFATITSEWLFWATLGLLLGAALRAESPRGWPATNRLWRVGLALSAWLLIWSLAAAPSLTGIITENALRMGGVLALCLTLLALVGTKQRWRNAALIIGIVLLVVVLQARLTSSLLATLAEFQVDSLRTLLIVNSAIYIAPLAILALWSMRRQRRSALLMVAMLLVSGWWIADAGADDLVRVAFNQADPNRRADVMLAAVALKPYDDRLLGFASGSLLSAGLSTSPQSEPLLNNASALMDRASVLNGYDVTLTLQRAHRAVYGSPTPQSLDQADRFYAIAASQWPTEAGLMLDWAHFVLTVRHEPERAIQLARQAQQRYPAWLADTDYLVGEASRVMLDTNPDPAIKAQAEAAYRRVLAAQPQDADAALGLAHILFNWGELDSAQSILISALHYDQSPMHRVQLTLALADVLDTLNEPDAALIYLEAALKYPLDQANHAALLAARERLRRELDSF
ncbi:MAG: O-antigen ligase family protein [Chloroflexota bacterium]